MLKAHSVDKTIIQSSIAALEPGSPKLTKQDPLTGRERDIIEQIKKGHSAKKIGIILHISNRTVEKHIENIKFKLKCRNKIEIINVLQK